MRVHTAELAGVFLENCAQGNTYPFTNNRIFLYEEKIGKDFFAMTEQDFISFFFDEVGINSVATLDCYRTLYLHFIDWCIARGEWDGGNLFADSVYLDSDTLADYMAKKCPLYYFSAEDIAFLCENTQEAPVLSELLIRCFYEGVSSYDELIHLKWQQVDSKRRILHLDGRDLRISERLVRLFDQVMDGEVEIRAGRNGYELRRLEQGDVLVYRLTKDTDVNRKQFLKRRLEHVAKQAGVQMTAKRLYLSGLLRMLREECGDEETLIHMLYEEKNKKTNAALDALLVKHGYPMMGSRVRYMFKPYMMQLLASRAKDS